MKSSRILSKSISSLLFLGALGAAKTDIQAATIIWDGGPSGTGTELGNAANWNPDTLPNVNGDVAEWNGTAPGPLALTYTSGLSGAAGNTGLSLSLTSAQTQPVSIDSGASTTSIRLNNITIAAGAGAFTLGDGTGTFNVTWGGAAGTRTLTNNSSNVATINSDVVSGGGGAGITTFNFTGSGNWLVNANLNSTNQGANIVTKTGTGTLTLGGTNTYAGATNVTAGTVNLTGSLGNTAININPAAGTLAVMNSSGTVTRGATAAVATNVGTVAGGTGVLNITDGTWSGGTSAISAGTAGHGVINVTGGSVTPGQFLVAGITTAGASGIWTVSGGSVQTAGNNGGTLGATAGTTGVLNVTGTGSYSSTGTTANGASGLFVGEAGAGILNVSGGGVLNLGGVATSAGLDIGRNNVATSSGIVNLGALGVGGGTISTNTVRKTGAASTGIFNFHGGTLQAASGIANPTFMSGLTAAYVYGEGGTIDNNAQNITIAQPLLAPTGNGVSAIALSGTTTGFTPGATPLVTISGDGIGATAIANVDASGNLTVTITNPGTGYTSAPTVAFAGTAGLAPVGTASLAPNVSGGLTYTGSGTTTLTGASTYSGTTSISGGTLRVNGSLSSAGAVSLGAATLAGSGSVGAVTVTNPNAVISNGTGAGDSSTFTLGSLTFNSAGTLSLNKSSDTATPALAITGALTTTPGMTVNVATAPIWVNGSTYNLLSYGNFSGSPSNFTLGTITGLGARQGATIGNTGASNGFVTLSIFGDTPYWTGLQSNAWTTNPVGGARNWKLLSNNATTEFLANDQVLFNDNATGTTVNITDANVGVASVTFANNTKNFTITSTGGFGIVDGSTAAPLVKNGTGNVTIETANAYSGGTTLNAGRLTLNNESAIGSGTLTINGGALDATVPTVLVTNNAQFWNGDISFLGTADLDLGIGNVTIGGTGADRTVTTTAGTLAVGELRAATHGLIKQGAGSLVLGSTGTASGNDGSRIAGVLNVAAGTLQINRTATEAANSGDFTVGGLTGSGTIVNAAASERWLVSNSAGTHVFTGVLDNGPGGALGFNKQGTGTQTLSGANSYSGVTTLDGGTLILKSANSGFGTNANVNSGTLVLANPSALGSTSLIRAAGNNVSSIVLATDGGDNLYNFTMGTGTVTTIVSDRATPGAGIEHVLSTQSGANGVGGGTINFTSGANVTSGTGRISFTQLGLGSGTGGAITTLNPTTANVTLGDVLKTNNTAAQTLELGGTSLDNQITGAITNGSATVSITKSGPSVWTLNGASTYTGATSITGGRLNLNGSIGGAAAGTAITVASGATLVEGSTGVIGGASTLNVAGTATLAGQNTFSGKTTINGGGVVTVSSLNSVGTPMLASSLGTPATVANGTIDMTGGGGSGTLIYTGTGETTDRVINLAAGANAGLSATLDQSGTGLLKFTSNFTATGTQTHTLVLQGSTTGAAEIAGAIVDNSAANFTSLTKRGTGTWTLSGASTYTGPTVVEGGTLITTPAQTGATSVTVADGAAFGVKLATAGTTFNVGTLTTGTTAGSTLLFDTGALGNPTAPLISATTFTPTAPTLLKVMGSGLTLASGIPLLDYTGSIGGVGFAGLSLALPSRTVGNLVDNTVETRVDLNITQFEQIRWQSNMNGNWDADIDGTGTTGTQNWVTTVTNTPTKYLQGTGGTDTVTFDDNATGTTSINIATAVAPVATNFNNSAKNYTVSSTGGFGIGGTGPLTKTGTGSITLNTANTYSGGTTLSAGTLVVGNASALGTGTLTINGGRLDANSPALALTTNNAQNWNADFTFVGSGNLDLGSGPVTIGGGGTTRTVTVNANTLSVGEVRATAHGFNKLGAGTLVVGSAGADVNGSVISGALNVGAGTLQINRTDATAAISGDFTATGLAGTGTIVNGAAVERWLFINTSATSDFSGTLANGGAGGLGFNKQGTGALTLSGANSYTGQTTLGGGSLVLKGTNSGFGTNANVTAGNLVLATANALGSSSLIRLAGTNTSTLTLATDADDNLYAFTQGTTTNSTIVSDRGTPGAGINHTLTTQVGANGVGGGSINFTSGANVTSGAGRITMPYLGLGAGSVQTTVLNPTTANVSIGDISKANNNVSQTVELGGTSQANEVTGSISNGVLSGTNTVSLTKSGTSTWTLREPSFYTGATAVNGGELIVSGSLNGTSSVNVATGATVAGNSSIATNGTGNVTLAAGGFLEPGNGATANIGTFDFNLGAGVLDLAAATTNTGSLKFDLAAPGASDLVTLSSGVLNIGTSALGFSDFAFSTVAGFRAGTYTLFDSFSPITGTLDPANLSGDIGGFAATLAFANDGNHLVLNVIPEPGSAVLLLSGVVGLLGFRRGRRRTF